jgi:hypothetical protein
MKIIHAWNCPPITNKKNFLEKVEVITGYLSVGAEMLTSLF